MGLAVAKDELPYTLDEEVEKAAKLQSQWPKRCGCGRVYTPETWAELELHSSLKDKFCLGEMRHCPPPCNSTLLVITHILDLKEE